MSSTGVAADPARADPRRGRPTAAAAATIEQRIRSAALTVFLNSGFAAATMDMIAGEAGVAKGTLYARFVGKDALFRAVLEQQLAQMSLAASAKNALLPDVLAERLHHRAMTLATAMQSDGYRQVTRLIDSVAHDFPDVAGMWHGMGTVHYVELIAADFRGYAPDNSAMRFEAEFLATLFLHAIAGWIRTETAQRALPMAEVSAYARRVIARIIDRAVPEGESG